MVGGGLDWGRGKDHSAFFQQKKVIKLGRVEREGGSHAGICKSTAMLTPIVGHWSSAPSSPFFFFFFFFCAMSSEASQKRDGIYDVRIKYSCVFVCGEL